MVWWIVLILLILAGLVLFNNRLVAPLLNDGRAVLLLDNKSGAVVPKVRAGDVIEVRHSGSPILCGVFKED